MRPVTLLLAGLVLLFSLGDLSAQEPRAKSESLVGRIWSSLFASKPAKPVAVAGERADEAAIELKVRRAADPVAVSRPKVENIDERSTHEQVALIQCVDGQNKKLQVTSRTG